MRLDRNTTLALYDRGIVHVSEYLLSSSRQLVSRSVLRLVTAGRANSQ
jgi:hypothetical protein